MQKNLIIAILFWSLRGNNSRKNTSRKNLKMKFSRFAKSHTNKIAYFKQACLVETLLIYKRGNLAAKCRNLTTRASDDNPFVTDGLTQSCVKCRRWSSHTSLTHIGNCTVGIFRCVCLTLNIDGITDLISQDENSICTNVGKQLEENRKKHVEILWVKKSEPRGLGYSYDWWK